DNGWLGALRSVAAQVGKGIHLEYRLANVLRKAGDEELALEQYAQVASQYPQDENGIRAAYQLAVHAEETGALDDAETRYLAIAANAVTKQHWRQSRGNASQCCYETRRCGVMLDRRVSVRRSAEQ